MSSLLRNTGFFLFLLIGIVALAPSQGAVSAQSVGEVIFDKNCESAPDSDYCKQVSSESSRGNRVFGPDGIITTVTKFMMYLTGIVSVIMIIIGGLRYVLSGGDSSATKGAKDTILYAVIGVVITIFAQIIVTFVLSKL